MKHHWQFSLLSLLLLMAILAIALALAANRPRSACVCLLLAGPFLIGRAMPFVCLHAPQQARWIMAGLVPAYSFACASLCLSGIQNKGFSWRMWLALIALMAIGILCVCLAWVSRGRDTKNADTRTNGLI
jgi:hypothetical protein